MIDDHRAYWVGKPSWCVMQCDMATVHGCIDTFNITLLSVLIIGFEWGFTPELDRLIFKVDVKSIQIGEVVA